MAQFLFTVSLREDKAILVKALAEQRGLSRNALIREGIDLLLAKYAKIDI